MHAWAAAADWLRGLGVEAIWQRVAQLTTRLQGGLRGIDGVEVFTPERAAASAGLVSFGLRDWSGADLAAALRERWNVVVKPLPHPRQGLRASLPFYLWESEVDLLVAALSQLARDGGGRPSPTVAP